LLNAFTSGGQAVSERPLALRPRLATGVPFSSSGQNERSAPSKGAIGSQVSSRECPRDAWWPMIVIHITGRVPVRCRWWSRIQEVVDYEDAECVEKVSV
jgi:hypothetical protein